MSLHAYHVLYIALGPDLSRFWVGGLGSCLEAAHHVEELEKPQRTSAVYSRPLYSRSQSLDETGHLTNRGPDMELYQ